MGGGGRGVRYVQCTLSTLIEVIHQRVWGGGVNGTV